MQKIKEIKRKKSDNVKQESNKKYKPSIEINNDIFYLISIIQGEDTVNKINNLKYANGYKMINGEIGVPIRLNLVKYRDIKVLHLYETNMFKFFNQFDFKLDCLILESLSSFDFVYDNVPLSFKLILKNTKIKYRDLNYLLQKFKPRALILEKVELVDNSFFLLRKTVGSIKSLQLCQFDVHDSFINYDSFLCIIKNKNINKFTYHSPKYVFSYSSYSGFITSARISNIKHLDILREYNAIESLSVDPIESRIDDFDFGDFKYIKHLVFMNCTISFNCIKFFKSLESITFEKCNLSGFVIYDILNLNPNLKNFASSKSSLPLDCVSIFKKNNVKCGLSINGKVF